MGETVHRNFELLDAGQKVRVDSGRSAECGCRFCGLGGCDDTARGVLADTDPQGPANGDEKVARGGSFAFGRAYRRTSLRSRNDPSDAFADLGFRCARWL